MTSASLPTLLICLLVHKLSIFCHLNPLYNLCLLLNHTQPFSSIGSNSTINWVVLTVPFPNDNPLRAPVTSNSSSTWFGRVRRQTWLTRVYFVVYLSFYVDGFEVRLVYLHAHLRQCFLMRQILSWGTCWVKIGLGLFKLVPFFMIDF